MTDTRRRDGLVLDIQRFVLELLRNFDQTVIRVECHFDQTYSDEPPYHTLTIEFREAAQAGEVGND
jgi:hypothetical protein